MLTTKAEYHDPGWCISDELWERIRIFLPPSPPHPLGCHRPAKDPRLVMDAIFFILRTGAQWKSLKLVSGSTAHRWFQFWLQTGVFHQLWKMLLDEYDDDIGIDWNWLSMDGSMVKSPLGGGGTGPNPTDRGKKRHQAEHIDRRKRYSLGERGRRSKRQ